MDLGEFAGKALRFTGKAVVYVGKAIVETAIEQVQTQKKEHSRMNNYNEHRLVDKVKSGSFHERVAAARHLKEEHGYSHDQIRTLYNQD